MCGKSLRPPAKYLQPTGVKNSNRPAPPQGWGKPQPLLGTMPPPYRVGAIPCGRPGGGGRPISTILHLTPTPIYLPPYSLQIKKPSKAFDSKGETVRLTGVTTSTSKPGSEGKRAAWYVTPSSSSIFNSGGCRSSCRAKTRKLGRSACCTALV